ncbi:MAG: DUF4365 domain-containing protein [Proteobacteria bacterium]|nr:DUF4365 domain-containing protein [Pseudomonadota bacterium]
MIEKAEKFPEQPESHIVGQRALDVFNYRRPQHWIVNPSVRDYGWDGLVEIGTGGLSFLVQMKGSGDPSYSSEKDFVSVGLKVATVNFLQGHLVPAMVCICDTGAADTPVYYAWLDEVIREIETQNPIWSGQETVTVRVPTIQRIDQNVSDTVSDYVSECHSRLQIGTEILEVMGVASGLSKEQMRTSSAPELMEQAIKPTLVKAGLIELSTDEGSEQINILSPEDQRRFKNIREISLLLNVFKDDEACQRLDRLESEIEQASDGIKAPYFNNRGVLALHTEKNDLDSLKFFSMAAQLRPSEPKYVTNGLWTEFSIRNDEGKADLSIDWQDRLDKVLASNPTFGPVVRLKAMQIAQASGHEAATDFIVKSQLWQKEPLDSRLCLIELLKDTGEYDRAIDVVEQTEKEDVPLNSLFYSLAGFIFLMKAVKGHEHKGHVRFSTGPADISPELLQKSSHYYGLAFKELISAGFPLPWEDTISNYSMILSLLGKYEEAANVAKPFLQRHPASPMVNDALASALFRKGEPENAVPYAEKAFAGEPTSHKLKNLCLCLFLAEDYEKLITTISENRKQGFEDVDEECLLRSLCAIAYYEIGEEEESSKQIRALDEKEFVADALTVKCTIASKNRASKETIIGILNQALEADPENLTVRTHIAGYLNPTTVEDAKIIEDCFEHILKFRDLLPEEYSNYTRAVNTLNKYEKARDILYKAVKRYPGIPSLIHDLALAVECTGDQETAYQLCSDYIRLGGKSYAVLKNTAILAEMTGRTDEAIKLFSRALSKSHDAHEQGDIHCQLYELKRRKGVSTKELISHIHEFGKTITGDDTTREARYLTMILMAPKPSDQADKELELWFEEAKRRLGEFERKHPKNPFLKGFKINTALSPEEQAWDMMTTISSVTLPARMRGAQLEMAARSGTWAFVFRAEVLSNSVFSYWSLCTASEERSHAIHIWSPDISLDEENKTAGAAKSACVDITTLLALAQLDMLDLLEILDQVVISLSTKRALAIELEGILSAPYPLAQKIDVWLRTNRSRVRVRRFPWSKGFDFEDNESESNVPGLLTPFQPSIAKMLPYGVGESVKLAAFLNLPLYSDDVFARYIALKDNNVKGFSTISMVAALREKGKISLASETEVFGKMLKLNFRIVPFNSQHLYCSLENVANSLTTKGRIPRAKDLIQDETLGSLLRQFADSSIEPAGLYRIAIDWWIAILEKGLPTGILEQSMVYLLFAFSQRTVGGVLKGVVKDEPDEIRAALLTFFLLKVSQKDSRLIPAAWSAVKTYCEEHYRDQATFQKVIFEKLPNWFVKLLEMRVKTNSYDKVKILASFTTKLPNGDRTLIEEYIVRHIRPSFLT